MDSAKTMAGESEQGCDTVAVTRHVAVRIVAQHQCFSVVT